MQRHTPKNSDRYQWTQHSIMKMQFYGLSEQKVLSIIRRPQRKEEGIVKNTVAVMQPTSVKMIAGKSIWKSELWVMYQICKIKITKIQETRYKQIPNSNFQFQKPKTKNYKLRIISAWRYPGVSPKNNPIPEEILRELSENVV